MFSEMIAPLFGCILVCVFATISADQSATDCASHSISAPDAGLRDELQHVMDEYGFARPERSAVDKSRPWRCGAPNYDSADLLYFRGRTQNHTAGSAAAFVENLVKTWEMEASHLEYSDWTTINHDRYRISANGGTPVEQEAAANEGNYNALLRSAVPEELYASNHTFGSSHELFRGAFNSGFPWELLHVLAGPPRVVFSWRHWARFDGVYRGRKGDGKTYELYGLAAVNVDDNLKITDIEVYYKPGDFLHALQGELDPEVLRNGAGIFGKGVPLVHDEVADARSCSAETCSA